MTLGRTESGSFFFANMSAIEDIPFLFWEAEVLFIDSKRAWMPLFPGTDRRVGDGCMERSEPITSIVQQCPRECSSLTAQGFKISKSTNAGVTLALPYKKKTTSTKALHLFYNT